MSDTILCAPPAWFLYQLRPTGPTYKTLVTTRIRLSRALRTDAGIVYGFAYSPEKRRWFQIDRPWREGRIEGVTT